MALDSRAKRASMIQMAHPEVMHLPIATGSVDQAKRQHFLSLYIGILAGEMEEIIILYRSRYTDMRLWLGF